MGISERLCGGILGKDSSARQKILISWNLPSGEWMITRTPGNSYAPRRISGLPISIQKKDLSSLASDSSKETYVEVVGYNEQAIVFYWMTPRMPRSFAAGMNRRPLKLVRPVGRSSSSINAMVAVRECPAPWCGDRRTARFYEKLGFRDTGVRKQDEKFRMKSGAIFTEMETVLKGV